MYIAIGWLVDKLIYTGEAFSQWLLYSTILGTLKVLHNQVGSDTYLQHRYSHLGIYCRTLIHRYSSMQVRGFQDHDTYSTVCHSQFVGVQVKVGRYVPAVLKLLKKKITTVTLSCSA